MLKCLIVPLLVSSITSAIGSLDLSMSGKIASRSIIYYMTTTVSAVILGIILVVTIRPGDGTTVGEQKATVTRTVLTADTLLDLIRLVVTFFYFRFAPAIDAFICNTQLARTMRSPDHIASSM